MKQLFPKEIIANTREVHHAKHSKKQQGIYLLISIAICAALISLPLIKIDIYTVSSGIIQSEKERLTLQTSYTGRVVKQYLKTNNTVQKGDTLVILDSHTLVKKENNTEIQKRDLELFISDVSLLIRGIGQPQSSKYQQEFLFFKEKQDELRMRLAKLTKDYTTDKKLYEKDVIARVDFEKTELEYKLGQSNLLQLEQQQKANWQSQLVNYREELRQLNTQLSEIQENKDYLVVKAPTTGTLVSVAGINNGSIVIQGMKLAELSPETALCVVCYIAPQDIGFLQVGDAVKFQIASFDYNQWGLATGKITSIGNDVQLIDNQPLFRVQCSLNATSLFLKNGFEGRLKKGMTLTARFQLTERTLFQLLYDKIDDWVNPNTQSQ